MASASQRDSDQLPGVISFRCVFVLGPFFRFSSLPLRLLEPEQGADLVWTEEMVAKKVAPCARNVNLRLHTIEFYDRRTPWTRVWQTCAAEKTRVVFQLGASTPEDAVAAAKVVEKDVAAFCLNIGLPQGVRREEWNGGSFTQHTPAGCVNHSRTETRLRSPARGSPNLDAELNRKHGCSNALSGRCRRECPD